MFKILIMIPFLLQAGAYAKDIKVVAQDFMPLAGPGLDGKPAGAYKELMDAICKKLTWNCTYEIVPIKRALKMIEDGEAHVMLAAAPTPDREAYMRMSHPVSLSGYTFFVETGKAAKFQKADDFMGKQVGVHAPSGTATSLHKADDALGKKITIVEENLSLTPIKKLSAGRYGADGAAFYSRPVGIYNAKQEKVAVEPVSFDVEKAKHICGLSKKAVDEETFKQFNQALLDAMKTPEVKKAFADASVTLAE